VLLKTVVLEGHGHEAHKEHGQVQLGYSLNGRWRRGWNWSGQF